MGDFIAFDLRFFISVLWQTTLALSAGGILSVAWRHHPGKAHYVLTLGLAASVALPAAYIAVQHAGLGILPTPSIASEAVAPATDSAPSGPGSPAHTPKDPVASWNWTPWLGALWICVSALLSLRLLATLGLGLRLLARAKPLINERLQMSLEAAMRLVGVERTPITFTTDRVHCPAIWCWAIHPAVLLPSAMVGSERIGARWTSVFSHELAHLKRRDHLAAILAEVVCCLLWWHPLVWLCRQRLNSLSDEACDLWVVSSGQPADEYAETLLGMVPQARTLTALSMVSGKRSLKRRLTAILGETPSAPSAGRRWLLTITVATFCLIALAACMQTRADATGQMPANNMVTNPDMEKGADAPDSWNQGRPVDGVEYLWDHAVANSGKSSLCLKKTAQRYFPIAEWQQKVGTFASEGGVRLKLGALVKAENAYKAILDVQYIDAGGEWKHEWAAYIGAKNNDDPPANHDWKPYGGAVDIPSGATDITVGLQIYGPGTVWFDDVSLTIVALGEESNTEEPKVGFAQ